MPNIRLIDANALLEKHPDCCDLRRKVEEMPTLTTFGTWIPCAERLPDTSNNVIVSALNGFGQRSSFTAFVGCDVLKNALVWWTSDVVFTESETSNRVNPCWTITHWMPMPEPPKEV